MCDQARFRSQSPCATRVISRWRGMSSIASWSTWRAYKSSALLTYISSGCPTDGSSPASTSGLGPTRAASFASGVTARHPVGPLTGPTCRPSCRARGRGNVGSHGSRGSGGRRRRCHPAGITGQGAAQASRKGGRRHHFGPWPTASGRRLHRWPPRLPRPRRCESSARNNAMRSCAELSESDRARLLALLESDEPK